MGSHAWDLWLTYPAIQLIPAVAAEPCSVSYVKVRPVGLVLDRGLAIHVAHGLATCHVKRSLVGTQSLRVCLGLVHGCF